MSDPPPVRGGLLGWRTCPLFTPERSATSDSRESTSSARAARRVSTGMGHGITHTHTHTHTHVRRVASLWWRQIAVQRIRTPRRAMDTVNPYGPATSSCTTPVRVATHDRAPWAETRVLRSPLRKQRRRRQRARWTVVPRRKRVQHAHLWLVVHSRGGDDREPVLSLALDRMMAEMVPT